MAEIIWLRKSGSKHFHCNLKRLPSFSDKASSSLVPWRNSQESRCCGISPPKTVVVHAPELDPDIRLSEAMRANLLVELSRLDRAEQLMVKAAARTHSVDEYAKVLVQHRSVVHMKERLLTSKDTSGPGRPWKRIDRPQERYPKFGYLGYGNDPQYQDAGAPEWRGPAGHQATALNSVYFCHSALIAWSKPSCISIFALR